MSDVAPTGVEGGPVVPAPVVLAHVVRSGFVESEHSGSAVALGPDESVSFAVGAPDRPVFARSAAKPLQAVAMLRAGLDLGGHLLALAAASHSGERFHGDGVLRILSRAGLGADALRNPVSPPLDRTEADRHLAAGIRPSRLAHNCSGQHAAMLATCVANGWSTASYLDPGHPLQEHITATVAELTGQSVAAIGVDGCGAPTHALTLTGLARSYARIITADPGSVEHRVAQAMRHYPEWVGGTGRDVTEVMRAVPGLVAKEGAEGVYAAALPDGRAAAIKIADGADRARGPVLAALLRRFGVDDEALVALSGPPPMGGGRPIGTAEVVGL